MAMRVNHDGAEHTTGDAAHQLSRRRGGRDPLGRRVPHASGSRVDLVRWVEEKGLI